VTDRTEGGPAGPTAYQVRLPRVEQDPEESAAASTDSPGALGASATLLAAVFAADCWRALQQSITREEALACARPFGDDGHAVHALLARWCTGIAGASELALRLPSLLGALLYLSAGLALCRLAFGRGWLAFVGFALLALDPLLFDLQSLGRGDGLALGLMLCGALALLHLLKGTRSGSEASFGSVRAIAGSLLLGLSTAACPSAAPAALSLLALAVAAVAAQRRKLPGGARSGSRTGLVLAGLLGAGPPLAALLLWLPLQRGGAAALFPGGAGAAAGALQLADASLAHQPDAWPLAADARAYPAGREAFLAALGPLLLLAMACRLALVLRRWRGATSLAELEPFERFHVLVGGALLLASAGTVTGHYALALPWPDARSGAPLLVLALLCATGLTAEGWRRGGTWRALSLPPLAALLALLLQFGSQAQVGEYYFWKQDAGARRCFDAIARRQDSQPRLLVHVAAATPLQPALDFYRVTRRAGWMEPVAAGFDPAHPEVDFLVVPAPVGRAARAGAPGGFAPVWDDPAGTVVLEASRD